MSNFSTFSIYKKPGNKASLVFRNKKIIYRITTFLFAKKVINDLGVYLSDLEKGRAEPEFLLELHSPKRRMHVLEIELANERAIIYVHELYLDGRTNLCFTCDWDLETLHRALIDFSVMAWLGR